MRRIGALLALIALSGCSLEPHYTRPLPAAPQHWPQGDAYLRQSEAALPSVSYGDIFRDARLQATIAQGLANNQDLRQALANIQSARALYRVQRADIFPAIDASAGASLRHNADNQQGVGGSGGGQGSNNGGHTTSYDIQAGTTAWEIDLFGRLRSLSHSAFDQYLASDAAARATRLTLVADIANAWLKLGADRSLLLIAQDTEKSAQTSVALTQARLDGGVAPRTDLRQAQTVLATAQADRARQQTLVAQDINALQLLVGAPVADAQLPATIEDADASLAELPAGVDSSILLRRPDVVEAEYYLRAANARIGAARAAFFPRIALTAVAGLASGGLSNLFSGGAFTWTVAPSATCRSSTGAPNRAISPMPGPSAKACSPSIRNRSRPRSAKCPTRSLGAARSMRRCKRTSSTSPPRRTRSPWAPRVTARGSIPISARSSRSAIFIPRASGWRISA